MTKCPVCKSEAQFIVPRVIGGKSFRCPKHEDFDVSDTVFSTRATATSAEWERALKNAINRAGAKRPKIIDGDFL
jgi:hypothetical protein